MDVERLAVVGDAARVGVADRSEAARDAAHRRLDRLVAASAGRGLGGTSRRRASRSGARRGAARAGRSSAGAPDMSAAVAVRIASCDDGALEHPSRVQDVDRRAPPRASPRRRSRRRGRDRSRRRRHPTCPRRTSTRPESSSTRSAWRSVGFEIPSSAASAPSFGSRSPGAEAGTLDRLGQVLDRGLERPRCADRFDREAHRVSHPGESRRIGCSKSLTAKQKRCFTSGV